MGKRCFLTSSGLPRYTSYSGDPWHCAYICDTALARNPGYSYPSQPYGCKGNLYHIDMFVNKKDSPYESLFQNIGRKKLREYMNIAFIRVVPRKTANMHFQIGIFKVALR